MNDPVRAMPMKIMVGPVTHIIDGVQFGTVTVRFEAGRPTMVERHEQIRITGGRPPDRGKEAPDPHR